METTTVCYFPIFCFPFCVVDHTTPRAGEAIAVSYLVIIVSSLFLL